MSPGIELRDLVHRRPHTNQLCHPCTKRLSKSDVYLMESQTKGVKRGRDQVLVSILPRCLSKSSVCLERADYTFLL